MYKRIRDNMSTHVVAYRYILLLPSVLAYGNLEIVVMPIAYKVNT